MPEKYNPIVRVHFTDTQEFIDEMRKAPPNVERVVRVTKQFRSSNVAPGIKNVSVLATYLRQVTASLDMPAPLQIIELRRDCGDWWENCGDDRPITRADGVIDLIENAAKGHSPLIRVHAGVYTQP